MVAILAYITVMSSVSAYVSHLALISDFGTVRIACIMVTTAGAFDLFTGDLADRSRIIPSEVDAVLLLSLVFAV